MKVNGETKFGPLSGSSTKEETLTIAANDVVAFVYEKDGSGDINSDTFFIYNFGFAAIA